MTPWEWAPAATITGHHVTLRPLEPSDAEALLAITPRGTFDYFLSEPRDWTPAGFQEFITVHASNPKTRAMAVCEPGTGRLLGSTAYLDIDPANRALEIGATWYAPEARRTMVNPECKLLLLERCFDRLGCVRVTLKCDARNHPSQRAIAALGATFEGTLRRHRIQPNGYVRDTVYFSVIGEEWPRVRERLWARLGRAAPRRS